MRLNDPYAAEPWVGRDAYPEALARDFGNTAAAATPVQPRSSFGDRTHPRPSDTSEADAARLTEGQEHLDDQIDQIAARLDRAGYEVQRVDSGRYSELEEGSCQTKLV